MAKFDLHLNQAESFLALHWQGLEPFAATWTTFFAAAVINFAYQYYRQRRLVSPGAFIAHCFPIDSWKSASSQVDVIMYFASKVIRGVLSIGDAVITFIVASGLALLLREIFPHHATAHPGVEAIVLWAFLLFLAGDFANFLTHYLQHKLEFLWELHKVHHSATFLSPLTTERMHPLGDKFDNLVAALLIGLPAGVAIFLYGLSLPALLIMLGTANMIGTTLVLDSLRHSQFPVSFGPLDRLLVSPHMHQFHHSAKYEDWDRNMGNKLSIWDWIFGTAVIPAKDQPLTFGIGRGAAYDSQYEGIWGVYLMPAVNMVRVLIGRQSQVAPPPQSLLDQGLTEPAPPPRRARSSRLQPQGARA